MAWTTKAFLKGPQGIKGDQGTQGLPGVNAVPADEAVAGFVSTPGTSATKTALNAVMANGYTGLGATTPASDGTRWVAFGDSLTSVAGGGAPDMGWVIQTGMLSNQRLSSVYNAGITGNNAAQMLARIQTDVLAYSPNFVTVWVGTNDITQQRTLAAFQADITAIVATLKRAGCAVALFTIPPRADATKYTTINAWNAWLKNFARLNAVHLIDAYSVLVNPATGAYKAGYDSGDGIHIAQAGHNAIATYVNAQLVPRLILNESLRPLTNLDTNNLLTNGLLLTNVDASPGVPDNWSVSGPTTGITETIVDDPDFQGGKAWQVAAVNPAGLRQFINGATTGWAVGDKIRFTVRVKCVSATGVGALKGLRINANFFGATAPTQVLTRYLSLPGLGGVVSAEFVVPAGTTGPVQVACLFDLDTTASATYRVGEFGIFNLTTLGIA